MQIEEQLVERKVAEYCCVRYLLMSIALYNIPSSIDMDAETIQSGETRSR